MVHRLMIRLDKVSKSFVDRGTKQSIKAVDQVSFGIAGHDSKKRKQKVDYLLERVGLASRADTYPAQQHMRWASSDRPVSRW